MFPDPFGPRMFVGPSTPCGTDLEIDVGDVIDGQVPRRPARSSLPALPASFSECAAFCCLKRERERMSSQDIGGRADGRRVLARALPGGSYAMPVGLRSSCPRTGCSARGLPVSGTVRVLGELVDVFDVGLAPAFA